MRGAQELYRYVLGWRATHIVQLEVETAGVANRVASVVPAPESCGLSLAITTAYTLPTSGRHSLLRPRRRSIGSVGLDVKAARVAHVVSIDVAPPEGRGRRPTVDTLAPDLAGGASSGPGSRLARNQRPCALLRRLAQACQVVAGLHLFQSSRRNQMCR